MLPKRQIKLHDIRYTPSSERQDSVLPGNGLTDHCLSSMTPMAIPSLIQMTLRRLGDPILQGSSVVDLSKLMSFCSFASTRNWRPSTSTTRTTSEDFLHSGALNKHYASAAHTRQPGPMAFLLNFATMVQNGSAIFWPRFSSSAASTLLNRYTGKVEPSSKSGSTKVLWPIPPHSEVSWLALTLPKPCTTRIELHSLNGMPAVQTIYNMAASPTEELKWRHIHSDLSWV